MEWNYPQDSEPQSLMLMEVLVILCGSAVMIEDTVLQHVVPAVDDGIGGGYEGLFWTQPPLQPPVEGPTCAVGA